MIAQMESGRVPKVESTAQGIAIWAEAGEPHGFVLDDLQASDVAVKMIAAVAKRGGKDTPAFEVSGFAFDLPVNIVENQMVRLVFDIAGAPITATLTLDQFGDMAANCADTARKIDSSFPRKHDY